MNSSNRPAPDATGERPTADPQKTPKSMWDGLRSLREAKPGHRFEEFCRRRRARRGERNTYRHVAQIGLGLLLIVVGISIGWLPGPGGFIAIIGLAVIAQELPFIARTLDRAEVFLRRQWNALRNYFRSTRSRNEH